MPTGQRIALIEDDQTLSKFMFEELSEAGFEVKQAFDGEEGLELIRSMKPDLVLLDIVMPKKTGLQVLEALRQDPITKAIPVIIISMTSTDDAIKHGMQLGANDYFVKSQHPIGEIVDKVKEFLSRGQQPS